MRTDRAYWARLRKDTRSNWATGLAVVAALVATVALMSLLFTDTPGENRLNPLYWLVLAPVGWWGASLASFEGWAVRLMLPVAAASPLVCAGVLVITVRNGEGAVLPAGASVLALVAATGAALLYRGSLLRAEGPSR